MSDNILQKKTITKMAKRSLQSGKIRNIFVMVTIILSVSLLTAIFMFGAGAQEEKRRQAAETSHAVFGNLTQEISAKLKEDDRLSYTVEAKQGIPTEMDGYNVIPRYIEELSSEINMGKLNKGKLPKKANEAAVQSEYLEKIGKKAKVGETFEISFYDGTIENFIISGLVSGSKGNKNYTLMVSKDYAVNSPQMNDIPFEMYAKIADGTSMTKSQCKDAIHQIGADAGLEYKYCMPNNSFLDTLSVDWQQVQIAAIVAGVILLACVLVIYGVFYISVVGRIHQFGQMRTIGMTRKQIRKFVKKEGTALFVRAFPIGLFLGGIGGYFIKPQGFFLKNTLIIFAAVAYGEYGDDTGVTFMSEKDIDAFTDLLDGSGLDREKLMSGNYVLVQGGNVMEEIYGWRLKQGDEVTFHYFDGSGMAERTLEVLAVAKELLDPMQEGWFYVPETAASEWTTIDNLDKEWIISTETNKETEAGAELEKILSQQPLLTMDTLQERRKMDSESCARIFGAITGISIFVIMFSILSMMNTLITNIITRKQELSMLESIGMQKRQVRKMLLSESVMIGVVNLIVTLAAGTTAGWGLCHMLNNAGLDYMIFQFPAVLFTLYAAMLLFVPVIITVVSIQNFSKESLVERLRGAE